MGKSSNAMADETIEERIEKLERNDRSRKNTRRERRTSSNDAETDDAETDAPPSTNGLIKTLKKEKHQTNRTRRLSRPRNKSLDDKIFNLTRRILDASRTVNKLKLTKLMQ